MKIRYYNKLVANKMNALIFNSLRRRTPIISIRTFSNIVDPEVKKSY